MSNGNEPAYPVLNDREYAPGLTKREAFAMAALQGLIAARAMLPEEYQSSYFGPQVAA